MHSDPQGNSDLCAQRADWTSDHCHCLERKGGVLLGFLSRFDEPLIAARVSLMPPEVRKCEEMSHLALSECA